MKELFACARPQGARPTDEAGELCDGLTYRVWRTETREYLHIERCGSVDHWFRLECIQ